jgi:hypothetical protein
MQFADYNAFRTALNWLIEGDELSDTFSVNTLDLIIGLAESRVYQGDTLSPALRASTMQEPLSVVVTANAAALPADLLELKEVYFSGKAPLQILPLDRLRALEAAESASGTDTLFCAQDGDTLRFWPTAEGTALGTYYKRPEDLATVTWADATTFARYPDLFTYACLYEAALFLGMVEKLPSWEARYRQLADAANHSERMRVYGGGPLRVRVR